MKKALVAPENRIIKTAVKRIGGYVRVILYYSDGTMLNTIGPNVRTPAPFLISPETAANTECRLWNEAVIAERGRA